MNRSASSAAGKERSRLDPEPIARRDFLGVAAIWSSLSALLFALLGMMRLPKAAVLPAPSKKFRVSLPESMPPGTPFMPPGRSVALFRDSDGVYALSAVCTHLGCVVKSDPEGFHCPCHGSRFAADGAVQKGPAPSPLAWLAISLSDDGSYVVDEGKTVPPGRKEPA